MDIISDKRLNNGSEDLMDNGLTRRYTNYMNINLLFHNSLTTIDLELSFILWHILDGTVFLMMNYCLHKMKYMTDITLLLRIT